MHSSQADITGKEQSGNKLEKGSIPDSESTTPIVRPTTQSVSFNCETRFETQETFWKSRCQETIFDKEINQQEIKLVQGKKTME